MHENEIASIVVDAAYEIHTTLGPGLLESVYTAILFRELTDRGLAVTREERVPVIWKGEEITPLGFFADLIVENKVIIELKSVETLAKVHPKQLLTYLRLKGCKLGLLINFGEYLIKDGIKRLVNGL